MNDERFYWFLSLANFVVAFATLYLLVMLLGLSGCTTPPDSPSAPPVGALPRGERAQSDPSLDGCCGLDPNNPLAPADCPVPAGD